ncbi:MAG: hypothetical protein ACOCZM_00905 [Bacillota bacterium]
MKLAGQKAAGVVVSYVIGDKNYWNTKWYISASEEGKFTLQKLIFEPSVVRIYSMWK